jgi:tetratricopeptide (TPR) repeat protein
MISAMFQHALALHRQGKFEDAAEGYEALLAAAPGHLDALVHLGVVRLGQGRAAEAETLFRRATELAPDSAEAHGNLAAALQALGRHEDAIAQYDRALMLRPTMADARFGMAACLQALGRHEAAIACYEAILVADTAHPEANFGLATALERLGRVDDAMAKYRAALSGDPDFAEASYGLGTLLARGTGLQEALTCFLHALDVDPDYIEARVALGTTLSRLDRDAEAMTTFHAVLASDPDNPEAHVGIGILLDRTQRHADALERYRSVLARIPEHVEALAGTANAMKNLGQHAEALTAARRVVSMRPNFAPAASLLGSILAEMGALDEARVELRRSVALAPDRPELLYHLALLDKVRPGDAILDALEAVLPRSAAYSPREQCLLHFAIAKAYDDVGERDRGFDHLLHGNTIKRSLTVYDEAAALGAMDRIAQVFTAEFMAARTNQGDPSTVPVFIVGMPRSGTTLVEQTLASHAAVFGAGERPELSQAISRLSAERLGAAVFPEAVWTMHAGHLREMGAAYCAVLRAMAPDALRITDKMPGNFLYIGLIRLILPNARIIHVLRDPADTCLSCYSKLFTSGQGFSYDLAELGRYHRAYQRLMAHWRSVLPAGSMLEVRYESLVENFPDEARRMVTYCGLPWDDACLDFHKSSRPVHTASMSQVRQPIYRSSVRRWRPDPVLLRPLLDALGADSRRPA